MAASGAGSRERVPPQRARTAARMSWLKLSGAGRIIIRDAHTSQLGETSMARCTTCKNTGIICKCREPSRRWCDKLVCRGHTCPDCRGQSESPVVDFVIGPDDPITSPTR